MLDNMKQKMADSKRNAAKFKRKVVKRCKKILKKNPMVKKEAQIRFVMKRTGWTHKYAAKQMADANQRLGISYAEYIQFAYYKIPAELQRGAYQKVLNQRERVAERREKCIADAMEKTGWSLEEATKQVDDAKKRLDMAYLVYMEHDFCLLTPEEQEEKLKEVRAARLPQQEAWARQIECSRNIVINKVMKKTGWDRDTTVAKIQDAVARTGCTYNEYFTYKFYELEDELQDQIFLMSFSKKLTAKYTTDRKFGKMLCNKAATNFYFTDCVKRPWCMNSDISFEEFREKFQGCKKIVYKPLGGNWGRGVVGFEVTGDMKPIYDEIMSYPEGVVEQFVVQHPKMNELSPTAVNTVRIVTISSNHEPITADGKMMDVAYASLKIGGVTSNIVDNLHGGGMVAGIDLEKGVLITDGADDQGNVYAVHPVTGMKIKGFEIPYFKEAIEMVTKAIQDRKLDGYLGWDVAISENGPELIETNLMPGVILLTMPYLAENKGMKPHMEQYYL